MSAMYSHFLFNTLDYLTFILFSEIYMSIMH